MEILRWPIAATSPAGVTWRAERGCSSVTVHANNDGEDSAGSSMLISEFEVLACLRGVTGLLEGVAVLASVVEPTSEKVVRLSQPAPQTKPSKTMDINRHNPLTPFHQSGGSYTCGQGFNPRPILTVALGF